MDVPIEFERRFWNEWNKCREQDQGDVSKDQMEMLHRWLEGRSGLRILDAGCGSGWTAKALLQYGSVVGTDLADEAITRARARVPEATFIAGDFMKLDLGERFDVVVCLEVLSHVADQQAFIERLAKTLKPGGELLLATQNRRVLERSSHIAPVQPGQRRRWLDRAELLEML
ncbi:MAG TPA: class I SAM-dependent methyltransferase, partial [Gammaproteobacteria bacterium]